MVLAILGGDLGKEQKEPCAGSGRIKVGGGGLTDVGKDGRPLPCTEEKWTMETKNELKFASVVGIKDATMSSRRGSRTGEYITLCS